MVKSLLHLCVFLLTLSLSCTSAQGQPNSYLHAPALAGYDATGAGFTVECWVRVRTLAGINPRIASAFNPNRSLWQLFICKGFCTQGAVVFDITPNDPTHNWLIGSTPIDDGLFHHVAATYDGVEMKVYVDGLLDARQTISTSANVGGGILRIGQTVFSGADQFDGHIDEFRIWKVARSQEEIQNSMNTELPGHPDLAAHWPLNGNVTDQVAGNDLTIEGTASICEGGGRLNGAADIFRPQECPPPDCSCERGNVNGVTAISDVLFVNGSCGGTCRTVHVPLQAPIDVAMFPSPAGPDPAQYALWVWSGPPTAPYELNIGTSVLGCTVNPTPLQPFASPQAIRCMRSPGIPSLFCVDLVEIPRAPISVPWIRTRSQGFAQARTITMQGILQDDGSTSSDGLSVTNAVVLVTE